jgi:hypothetical protein
MPDRRLEIAQFVVDVDRRALPSGGNESGSRRGHGRPRLRSACTIDLEEERRVRAEERTRAPSPCCTRCKRLLVELRVMRSVASYETVRAGRIRTALDLRETDADHRQALEKAVRRRAGPPSGADPASAMRGWLSLPPSEDAGSFRPLPGPDAGNGPSSAKVVDCCTSAATRAPQDSP